MQTTKTILFYFVLQAKARLVQMDGLVTAMCAACSKKGDIHLKCGACAAAAYCGKACQKAHWKAGHKHDCRRA